MSRVLSLLLLGVLFLGVLVAGSGCSMCQSCFDDAYPLYGSTAPRTDRYCGRVGSVFAPAGPDVGQTSPYVRETNASPLTSGGSPSDKNANEPSPAPTPGPAELPEPEEMMPPDGMLKEASLNAPLRGSALRNGSLRSTSLREPPLEEPPAYPPES